MDKNLTSVGWNKTAYGYIYTPPKNAKEANEVAQKSFEAIKKARQIK